MRSETGTIYVVKTEGDCEGKSPRRTLGYAVGDITDIAAFYDKSKEYHLFVEPILVLDLTENMNAHTRNELVQALHSRRSALEKELEQYALPSGKREELARIKQRQKVNT